jgi:hypothetical protein
MMDDIKVDSAHTGFTASEITCVTASHPRIHYLENDDDNPVSTLRGNQRNHQPIVLSLE